MKRLLLILMLGGSLAISNNIKAQHVSVNININTQPAWGPAGYDYVDFYYMPDINVYYIVNSRNYVFLDGNRWITARYLPYRYRNYDLYGMYKVVLRGGHSDPWRYNRTHVRDYGRYRNYRGQSVIRDSRDNRYVQSRNNRTPWYREGSPNRGNSSRPSSSRPSSSNGRDSYDRGSNRPESNRSNVSTRTRSSSSERPSTSNRTRY